MSDRDAASFEKRERRVTAVVVAVALIAIVAATVALTTKALAHIDAESPAPFNSVIWRRSTQQRFRMVDDLQQRHLLDGRSSADVQTLLGRPDYTRSSDEFYYDLGDGSSLLVDLGRDKNVERVSIPD